MHGLHELQRLALDLPRGRPVVVMANPRVGEHQIGLAGEEGGVMRKLLGYGAITIATVALAAFVINLIQSGGL